MTIRLNGSTSGYTEIDAPAIAGAGVLTLPTGTGTLLRAEGGKVLQVVRATDATSRSTTSTSFVDVTGMSVTITPQRSTSAVLIIAAGFSHNFKNSDGNMVSSLQITDSSNNAISGANSLDFGLINFSGVGTRQYYAPFTLIAYATPATTSAVTFKMRFKSSEATTTAFIGNAQSAGQMYAIEVSA